MAQLTVSAKHSKGTIRRHLFGHFSEHLGRCIYDGLYVGENSKIRNVNGMRADAVEALRAVKIPVLRWPGGCFADEYHWRDGVGPKENRKRMVNTNWGGVVEDNSFGTHEFMEFCRQVGCEPYINGNVGSGTVQEMSEWVEYMTFDGESPMANLRRENGQDKPWKLKYICVGNESWGCGGNMRPEYYADLYRHYQTFLRNYGDNKLYKIAVGPSGDDYAWTDTLMKMAGKYLNALTLHYYTVPGPWEHKGSATQFTQEEYYLTLKKAFYMDELVTKHSQIMDRYDPDHKVDLLVDEWGTWFDVEPGTNPGFLYQQSTMRDAMVAALTLNIFNQHSDRVAMANIAQLVNVLQAVILTEGDKMVLTPTYHVFDLYKVHQDATLLGSFTETKEVGVDDKKVANLSVSASEDSEGVVHVTVANLSADESCPVELDLLGQELGKVTARILAGGMDDYTDFDAPNKVSIQPMDGIVVENGEAKFTLPACSVAELTLG